MNVSAHASSLSTRWYKVFICSPSMGARTNVTGEGGGDRFSDLITNSSYSFDEIGILGGMCVGWLHTVTWNIRN